MNKQPIEGTVDSSHARKNSDQTNKAFGEFADLCTDLVLQMSERSCAGAGKKSCIQKKRKVRCHACQAKLIVKFGEEILDDEEVERSVEKTLAKKKL